MTDNERLQAFNERLQAFKENLFDIRRCIDESVPCPYGICSECIRDFLNLIQTDLIQTDLTDEELREKEYNNIIIMNSEEKKQNEKTILMKTLLDLYEQNELFQNIVVQEYIDKLETKLKELL